MARIMQQSAKLPKEFRCSFLVLRMNTGRNERASSVLLVTRSRSVLSRSVKFRQTGEAEGVEAIN